MHAVMSNRRAYLDLLLDLLEASSALLGLDLLGRQLRTHRIRGRPGLRQIATVII